MKYDGKQNIQDKFLWLSRKCLNSILNYKIHLESLNFARICQIHLRLNGVHATDDFFPPLGK